MEVEAVDCYLPASHVLHLFRVSLFNVRQRLMQSLGLGYEGDVSTTGLVRQMQLMPAILLFFISTTAWIEVEDRAWYIFPVQITGFSQVTSQSGFHCVRLTLGFQSQKPLH